MDQRACPERAGPFCMLKAAVCQTESTAWQQSSLGRRMGAMAKGGAKLQGMLHGEFILARAGTLEFGTLPLGLSEFGTQTLGPSEFGTQTSGPSEFGTTAANTRRHKRRSTLRPQSDA